ncbi:hypothetical protein IG616_21070 [Labrenzia suaedae]|uniref:Lycopene cyclase domain-containing protein n=2 Tax=Roseibium litorale TaxID=2803841 RepID=A0ABR9CT31_9HYPH|nr:hypothetical protein [Roseibium litorale]
METFIYGLVLAGFSALGIVAYKHPDGYAKLYPVLAAINFLVMITDLVIPSIYLMGARSYHDYYKIKSPFEEEIFKDMLPDYVDQIFYISAIFAFYLSVLVFVPHFTEDKNTQ